MAYDPNYVWDFVTQDGLEVGSVGYAPSGTRMPLGQFKTVGISGANGSIMWRLPGEYDCGGSLQFLTPDVVCDLSGSAIESAASSTSFVGLGLTLKGLDPSTGRTTSTSL